MRQGRLAQALATTVGALIAVNAGAVATTEASQAPSAASLVLKVATATDARQVIVLHQPIATGTADVTYSDAPRQLELEYIGSRLYAGDVHGTWFTSTAKHCYSATKEPFVGLSSIGSSLLPQASATGTVAYKQLGPQQLQWTIAATKQHGIEHGRVWFNSADLIVKSQTRSYTSGQRATTQATTLTLTYPSALPANVTEHRPTPVCKAEPQLRSS
jgi:hypothetical protein